MTAPLTGQRSRSELIAELYERHAAGLFAYCHDQLGETSSAGDAVVAVFTSAPPAEPPSRAALYTLARREIYRRDVSYALPAVDSVADPATALIERVFRDIRPHQREVLLLSAVCGLETAELSAVLDVARDTAEELTYGARRRFAQTLETAVAAARSAPYMTPEVAEVYDAINVAPVDDVLARLPWRRPAASVRDRVLSALPYEGQGTATGPGGADRKLWPTSPTWPLPLSDPNQVSNTIVVKADVIKGRGTTSDGSSDRRRRARHEAATEPLPKLRGSVLSALGESLPRRKRPARPSPAGSTSPAAAGPTTAGAAAAGSTSAGAAGPTAGAAMTTGAAGAPGATPPAGQGSAEPAPEPTTDVFDAFRPADPFRTSDPFRTPDPVSASDPVSPSDPVRQADAFSPFEPVRQPDAFSASEPVRQPDAFSASEPVRQPDAFSASDLFRPAGSRTAGSRAADTDVRSPLDGGESGRDTETFPAIGGGMPLSAPPAGSFAEPLASPSPTPLTPPPVAPGTPGGGTAGDRTAGGKRGRATGAAHRAKGTAGKGAAVKGTTGQGSPRRSTPPRQGPNGQGSPSQATPVAPGASAASAATARKPGHRGKDRHYDWVWELLGFLICLAIALIVFFAVPTIVSH
ncbi:hypothetical protein JOL79_06060 [Microbispora sp. RL4-1S]|uniref:Uncharacterized protein n=1 Tax=Microbispora oryzae TaxID=2806554 RepID=A0A941AI26_9ACTN|nr:sigma-70 family RNA polymerase sigma factor [Microbispora oryzae]MBP2703362.1 hypothetical protein [Microbispora oryzae]